MMCGIVVDGRLVYGQEPTPIQRQAIPIGLQNRDLIGIAETGEDLALRQGLVLCRTVGVVLCR